jgi:hypothetical protein
MSNDPDAYVAEMERRDREEIRCGECGLAEDMSKGNWHCLLLGCGVTDSDYCVVPAAVRYIDAQAAEIEALRARCARLEEALSTIRDNEGHVCEEFETCTHSACRSSMAAWSIADAALSSTSDAARLAEQKRAAQVEVLRAVNATAEADMLKGRPVTGAHHRAIEAKLRELETAG